jgi:hypothetical protein
VGEIDSEGNYLINNLGLLQDRINDGGIEGQSAQEFYDVIILPLLERDENYAFCVLDNTFTAGIFSEIKAAASGDVKSFLITYLTQKDWPKVASFLVKILAELGVEISPEGLIAKLAIAAVSCWL